MIKKFNANKARLKRHYRMRNRLEGTTTRPRLSVFRSGVHIYAQVIDDTTGRTLVAASSLDETLRDFKPVKKQTSAAQVKEEQVEEAARTNGRLGCLRQRQRRESGESPRQRRSAAKRAQGKGGKPGTQSKTVLPSAQKGEKKTPVEALAAIADNHKVALAREVGKLVAQRAKEKGVSRVVFDRGGYAYHGRVAALAEGAREVGLDF